MNKKRLQRLGVVCMAAAMVLTTVSFPRAAKAEGETSTQTNEATSTELETGKVLMQVDPTVLQDNAISNSQQAPSVNADGPARWAFDDVRHWWHTHYDGTLGPSNETINEQVRPWIGSGFGQEITLKKVTYQGRADNAGKKNGNNSIGQYILYYADMANPAATPGVEEWQEGSRGSFTNTADEQEIVLNPAVKATHFKLVAVNTINRSTDTTCAQNIKVYAEETLNLTVTAPVDGHTLEKVKNEAFKETPATVKDTSKDPIDISTVNNITVNEDGTFDGQIANVNDSKLNDLTGRTPFMIRMKVKLNVAATKSNILINRGDQPYQIAYDTDRGSTDSKIKFQMKDTGGTWHEVKVPVTGKIGQEIDILALYTGSGIGLWVDGRRDGVYEESIPNFESSMITGTANALKIGMADSQASIKSVQVVKDIGTISNNAEYDTLVMPAFGQGNRLLDLRVVENPYDLTSEWKKWTNTTEEDATEAVDTDGSIENYRAVVTATPTGSLEFTADSMPQMLKVNVDGTHIIEDVPVTKSSVENGVLKITYDFEELFIGGSLRMDYGDTYDKTSMRYGYDFKLPEEAKFVGCDWYYGTSVDNLTNLLNRVPTKHIIYQDEEGADVYRSNIVFTGIGKDNYQSNVYSRILVKYTLGEKNYSKMGSFIDTRTVEEVANKIIDPNSGANETQKTYANGILNAIHN